MLGFKKAFFILFYFSGKICFLTYYFMNSYVNLNYKRSWIYNILTDTYSWSVLILILFNRIAFRFRPFKVLSSELLGSMII